MIIMIIFIRYFVLFFIFLHFCRLFEEHEEMLQLFTKFGELKTKDAQANSMELAEHANKVMTTLDEGIKELDDLDSFFQYLTQVGASHKNIPNFNPEFFWVSDYGFYIFIFCCDNCIYYNDITFDFFKNKKQIFSSKIEE